MIAIKFTVIFISFALAASRAFRGSNFKSAGDCLEKVNATFVELTPEGFYQRVTVIIERLTDPSIAPTEPPTQIPSMPPTDAPTLAPTVSPTTEPTAEPTVQPTQTPSVVPTVIPTVSPSILPTVLPTTIPTVRPSVVPTIVPTITPTSAPTMAPTVIPSESPSTVPTIVPTTTPSVSPSVGPSRGPTQTPTINPTRQPSVLPTTAPTLSPTVVPSVTPTAIPSTAAPSQLPYLVKDALSAVSNPGDMAFDDQNCLYVADGSYILRYNTSSGLTVIAAGAPVEYIPLSSAEDVAATSVGLYGQRLTIRGTDMYTTGLRSILKVNLLSGMIRGFAGRPVGESCGDGNGDGGSATAACFDNTSDLFADSVGGLYVLTKSAINHFIRYIDPTGIVSTYAGTMAASMNEAGVAATSAMISVDRMTGDTLGSLFYTSTTVKMIDASRIIRDFAGATSGAGILPTYSNGVAASEASLDATYFAINPINGDLYYESYCNIYKVSASTNKVTQLAGLTCSEGDVSLYLSGRSAFNTALGAVGTMAIDMNGKFLYFFGFNGIRVVSIEVPYTSPPTSLPTTRQPSVAPTTAAPTHLAYQVQNVVGTGTGGSGCSALKVTGSIATSTGIFFNNNEQLTFDGNDNLYVSNYGCQVILKVNSGIVSVAAGGGSVVPTANNEIAATSADLTRMWSGLAARGNDVFVQNFQNNYVTRMDATTGNFKIVFGTGSATNTGDGLPASSASIVRPFNIVADTVGALYVGSQGCTSCGQGGWVIRKINAAGIVSTVAGIVSAEAGPTTSNLAGVAATSVTITANGLAVDTVGNIFLTASKKVSIIGSDGIMRDFVGGGTVNPDTVGPVPATSANLNTFIVDVNPQNGDLFLSNLVTSNINKVARSTMIVTKFAGQGYQENHGDGGPASSAVLRVPVGMAFDSSREKLYWVEQFNVRSAYLN